MTKKTRPPEKTIPAEAKDIASFAAMKMAVDDGLAAWEANPTIEAYQADLAAAVRGYRNVNPQLFDAEGVTAVLVGFALDPEPDPIAYLIREFGPLEDLPGPLPWAPTADTPAPVKRTPKARNKAPKKVRSPGKRANSRASTPVIQDRAVRDDTPEVAVDHESTDAAWSVAAEEDVSSFVEIGPDQAARDKATSAALGDHGPVHVTIAVPADDLDLIDSLRADEVEVIEGIEEADELYRFTAPMGDLEVVVTVTNGTAGKTRVHATAWIQSPSGAILNKLKILGPLAGRHVLHVGLKSRSLAIVAA